MKKAICRVISVILAVAAVITTSSCTFFERKNKDIAYYSNIGNYVQATGTVIEIVVYDNTDDDDPSLLLEIDETDYDFKYSGYHGFEIAGDNWTLVRDRGILEKLHEGDRIVFVAAKNLIDPIKVTRPIVALSVNGEKLLSLKEGYNNYIEYIKSRSIFEF